MGNILKKIMILEDSDLIRTSLALYLKKMGYVVYDASNCKSALKIIKENDIALFIVDIDMSDNERIKFFNEINNDDDLRYTPIIMISGEHKCNIIEKNDDTGERFWMINTFDAVKLFSTIKNLLAI